MDSVGDYDSPFEVAVARYLRDKGWEVVPQIGVSRFRIDLGIVHPEKPGRYLAGVECDGATYHSSATARDRDKIRQAILENLGWNVLRIWSTDWWHNPEHAIDNIHGALEELLEQEKIQEEKNDDAETDNDEDISGESGTEQPGISTVEEDEETSDLLDLTSDLFDQSESDVTAPEEPAGEQYARQAPVPGVGGEIADYVLSDPGSAVEEVDPESFNLRAYSKVIRKMIMEVIRTEAPIHENVLIRRIARAHGFERAGNRIKKRVLNIAKHNAEHIKQETGIFFFGIKNEAQVPVVPRANRTDDVLRSVDNICDEEIKAMATAVDAFGEERAVMVARGFGISRLTTRPRQRIERLIT